MANIKSWFFCEMIKFLNPKANTEALSRVELYNEDKVKDIVKEKCHVNLRKYVFVGYENTDWFLWFFQQNNQMAQTYLLCVKENHQGNYKFVFVQSKYMHPLYLYEMNRSKFIMVTMDSFDLIQMPYTICHAYIIPTDELCIDKYINPKAPNKNETKFNSE